MNKCQYCSKETDLPRMHLAMALPIKEMEEKINKLGRDDWFKNVDWDKPPKELDELSFYDQLLNTVGRGYSCKPCLEEGDKLYEKYYGKSK